MISKFSKLSRYEKELIIGWLASMILSFLFGFVYFRYWEIEYKKPDVEVGTFDYEMEIFTEF